MIRASSANIVFLGLAVALLSGAAYPGGVNFDAPAHDEFGCNQNSWVCAWDYLSLPQRFPQHASPQRWTSAELTDWVQQARDQLVQFEEPQPAEHELAGRIRETLDADWLWRRNGLFGGTPAEVRVGPLIPPHRHRDHERTHVWIEDDVALGFPAIVMLPPGPGPGAAPLPSSLPLAPPPRPAAALGPGHRPGPGHVRYMHKCTHTYTHAHIYIYIYIYPQPCR